MFAIRKHLSVDNRDFRKKVVSVIILIIVNAFSTWYHFYNLKTHEKHPWKSATLLKVALSYMGFFHVF